MDWIDDRMPSCKEGRDSSTVCPTNIDTKYKVYHNL